ADITDVDLLPIADGGEGTVAALLAATGGQSRTARVTGPMGKPVVATWGLLGDGQTAVLEMAAASGLPLVPEAERDILRASTYGTGELIRAALDAGCPRIVIGLGGSATNDGGAGMAQALGAHLLDARGAELGPGGGALAHLARLDLCRLDMRLRNTTFFVACDVRNPLCGPQGASAIFGPQKGASPAQVTQLDANLRHYASLLLRDAGADVQDAPGAGAAGGLGAGMMAFLGAQLRPGFTLVAEETHMDARIAAADCVITGEGCTDAQTLMGKAPAGVASLARAHGVMAICLSGCLRAGYEALYETGMTACFALAQGPTSLADSIAQTPVLLEARAQDIGRILRRMQDWSKNAV
ncbi:MAG: glycerate kinase, partial [Clostridia bacterium]